MPRVQSKLDCATPVLLSEAIAALKQERELKGSDPHPGKDVSSSAPTSPNSWNCSISPQEDLLGWLKKGQRHLQRHRRSAGAHPLRHQGPRSGRRLRDHSPPISAGRHHAKIGLPETKTRHHAGLWRHSPSAAPYRGRQRAEWITTGKDYRADDASRWVPSMPWSPRRAAQRRRADDPGRDQGQAGLAGRRAAKKAPLRSPNWKP